MKNKKNPGNVEIWWGKTYKGHEIRKVYQAPRYMRWLLSRDNEERSWVRKDVGLLGVNQLTPLASLTGSLSFGSFISVG